MDRNHVFTCAELDYQLSRFGRFWEAQHRMAKQPRTRNGQSNKLSKTGRIKMIIHISYPPGEQYLVPVLNGDKFGSLVDFGR